jgi:hypothetical protein
MPSRPESLSCLVFRPIEGLMDRRPHPEKSQNTDFPNQIQLFGRFLTSKPPLAKGLKIRVSVVRFRPWPPEQEKPA